jgi:hypothetical protein
MASPGRDHDRRNRKSHRLLAAGTQTVWFHRLGTTVAADRYAIWRDFPRIAEIAPRGSRDGKDRNLGAHGKSGGK